MTKSTALGILGIVTALGLTASSAQAGFCSEEVRVPSSGDTGDVACRDDFGSIVGVARLFNGPSRQLRARLVSGTQFGAIGIDSRGLENFDCNVFTDLSDTLDVNGNLACSGMVAMRLQGL